MEYFLPYMEVSIIIKKICKIQDTKEDYELHMRTGFCRSPLSRHHSHNGNKQRRSDNRP